MVDMNDNKVTSTIRENKHLFDHLLDEGYTREEAFKEIVQLGEERKEYLLAVKGVSVNREIALDIFNSHFGDYASMPKKKREETLYNLGFDVVGCNVYLFRLFKRCGKTNKMKIIPTLVGQERLDTKWINKRDSRGVRFASLEAVDAHKNMADPTRQSHIKSLFGG